MNNYSPIFSLRTAAPLLLQIPFFTAAYIFFNNKTCMNGVHAFKFYSIFTNSFQYLIYDLGKPDNIIKISDLNINLLPIIMTIINIITAVIYTSGQSIKTKIQSIILASIFLVLLYNSPSCLVLYWLFNNVFSLFKTIIYKSIDNRLINAKKYHTNSLLFDQLDIGLIYTIIVIFSLCLFLSVYILSTIIKASPIDFCFYGRTPFDIIKDASIVFFGFGCWILIYYILMDKKCRNFLDYILFFMSCIAIINFSFFGTKFGPINADFQYTLKRFSFSMPTHVLCLIVMITVFFFTYIVYKHKLSRFLSIVLFIVVSVVSVINIVQINQALINNNKIIKNSSEHRQLNLSKNGKNVLLIIPDMAKGAYVPYVFNTFPDLKLKFDGFTHYRNTISFGSMTVFGLPSIMGGYDYIPYEQNKRLDIPVYDKIKESYNVMPKIFTDNDFDVNLVDFAGTDYGKQFILNIDYNENVSEIENIKYTYKIITNFFIIMKSLPTFLQELIYHNGTYFKENFSSFRGDIYFPENFYKIKKWKDLFAITDINKNTFTVLYNNLPHYDAYLSYPNYDMDYSHGVIADENIEYFDDQGRKFASHSERMYSGFKSLNSNIATYIQIANLLDKLKEMGVYDNTRIIIASDHGYIGDEFDYLRFLKNNGEIEAIVDIEPFNSVLLYKDFDQKGFVTDNTFMTQSDVPTLAFESLIINPINPFTKKSINSNYKKNNERMIIVPNWSFGFETDLSAAEKSNLPIGENAIQYLPRTIQSQVDLRDPKDTTQIHYTTYSVKSDSDIFNPDNWEIDFEPIIKYNKNFNDKKINFENYIK